MRKKPSKYDLDNLFPIAITLLVLGIAMAYGINVVADIRDDLKADLTSTAVVNETVTALSNTTILTCRLVDTGAGYYALSNSTGIGDDEYINWTYVSSANMTIGEGGRVTISHAQIGNNQSKVNYNCLDAAADYNASKNVITGVAKIPEKMPLIATIIVAAIIIGILIRYLIIKNQ